MSAAALDFPGIPGHHLAFERESDGSLHIDSAEIKVDKGARKDKVGGALWPY